MPDGLWVALQAAKEARQKEMAPRERDYEAEQRQRVAEVRAKEEAEGDHNAVRQCNEPKLDFRFDEEERPGFVVLDVGVPKHLDSSLIDVDVHPAWASIVIKGKVLRLRVSHDLACHRPPPVRWGPPSPCPHCLALAAARGGQGRRDQGTAE